MWCTFSPKSDDCAGLAAAFGTTARAGCGLMACLCCWTATTLIAAGCATGCAAGCAFTTGATG